MKKKQILKEFVDKNNTLIGIDTGYNINKNSETNANQTTDKNVFTNAQNFSHDFLGRFGFSFYENDGDNINVDKIKDFIKILKTLKGEMFSFFKENKINSFKDGFDKFIKFVEGELSGIINESVVEDKVLDSKSVEKIKNKKDEDEIFDEIKNVADVLSKLNKNDINKLIRLLEKKVTYE